MSSNNAIIIGSGVAGMATAIRLAVKGYAVTVYEKNATPGGKLSLMEKDGFRFDTGPSLFTEPQNIEELFELAGEAMDAYLQYRSVPIACKYFFANGKVVNAPADADALATELQTQLNEDPAKVKNYLRRSSEVYEHIGSLFTEHSLHKRRTFLHSRVLKAIGKTKLPYLFRSLNQYNEGQFNQPETTQLFNRYATYNGSNPYKAPAMLSLIPHLEHNLGVFYPRGGMISITNALYQLALKKGVVFHFDSPVERIIHHEGKVRGVVVKEQNIFAGLVVSNMDVYFTYGQLLRNEPRAKKILKQERSSSAFVFYWGMKKGFPELQLHNIFFSGNYREEFVQLFKGKGFAKDLTVYINITSKMEEGHAPSGQENWFVMVNAPANTDLNWTEMQQQIRPLVIEKINTALNTNIEPFIATESCLNPAGIEAQTASYRGSLYGTSSNSRLAAFLRHPNFTSLIKGLYFCGGSVHPGGGIPLCLKSAKIVSDAIPVAATIKNH
jgi:phytoene desaturase